MPSELNCSASPAAQAPTQDDPGAAAQCDPACVAPEVCIDYVGIAGPRVRNCVGGQRQLCLEVFGNLARTLA